MYHAACKVEFSTIQSVVLTADVFNFYKIMRALKRDISHYDDCYTDEKKRREEEDTPAYKAGGEGKSKGKNQSRQITKQASKKQQELIKYVVSVLPLSSFALPSLN